MVYLFKKIFYKDFDGNESSTSLSSSSDDIGPRYGPRYHGLRTLVNERLQSDSPSDVAEALLDLDALLLEDDHRATARDACAFAAPATIVSCMKNHLQEEELQDWALWCLHRLAVSHEDARAAILASNGVQVIVSAMKLFPGTADIQRGGCLALASTLAAPLSCLAKDLITRLVKEWGGLDLVLNAMRHWPEDRSMQEAAIRLICCLSVAKEARFKMIDQGAVSIVTTALDTFPTDESIKVQATPFMKTMLKTMLFSNKGKSTASRSPPRQRPNKSPLLSLKKKGRRGSSVEC